MPTERSPFRTASVSSGLSYKFYDDFEEITLSGKRCVPCHMVVTWKSLVWSLFSILATGMITVALFSPNWLIGKLRTSPSMTLNRLWPSNNISATSPTIGVFTWCPVQLVNKLANGERMCSDYVIGSSLMPDVTMPFTWKLTMSLFAVSEILLLAIVCLVFSSLFIQNICYRSILTITGLIQSIAGTFFLVR